MEPGAHFRVCSQIVEVTLRTEPCMLMIDEETVLVWIMQAVVCGEYLLEAAKTWTEFHLNNLSVRLTNSVTWFVKRDWNQTDQTKKIAPFPIWSTNGAFTIQLPLKQPATNWMEGKF